MLNCKLIDKPEYQWKIMSIAERIFSVNTNIGNVGNKELIEEISSTSTCDIGFNRKQFVIYVLDMETVTTFNYENASDFNPVHIKAFQIEILFSTKCPKFQSCSPQNASDSNPVRLIMSKISIIFASILSRS